MDLYDRIREARRDLERALDDARTFAADDGNFEDGVVRPIARPTYDEVRGRLDEARQSLDMFESLQSNERAEELAGIRGDGITGSLAGRRSVDPREPMLLERTEELRQYASLAGLARGSDGDALSLGRLMRGMFSHNWEGADAELRAAQEGTSSAGGVLVPTPLAVNIIDRARAQARVFQAGARTVPMDSMTLTVPRLTGSSAPAWHSESALIATGDLTFSPLVFTARTLSFIVQASMELLQDSRPGFEQVLRNDFARQFALELDRVALRGTGTAPEPRGVKNTAGITTLTSGANGAVPTSYDLFIDLVQAVRNNNFEPSAIINAVRTDGTLAKLKEATTNAPLRRPPFLDDVRWLSTGSTQNPVNQTVGTSSDTTDAYAGDWSQLWVGVRLNLEIIPLRERFADVGNVGFLAWGRYDIQLAQPGAFAVLPGIRP
jgi:HK97 family phage major capsid protein